MIVLSRKKITDPLNIEGEGQMKQASVEKDNKFSDICESTFRKTLEAHSEKFPTTLEPPPQKLDSKNQKDSPQKRSGVLNVFYQRHRCLE